MKKGITACATPGLARLPQGNVTHEIEMGAIRILDLYWNHPVGSLYPFSANKNVKFFFFFFEK